MAGQEKLEICLSVPHPVLSDWERVQNAVAAGNEEDAASLSAEFHPLLRPGFKWPDFVRIRYEWMDTARCAAAIVTYPAMDLANLLRFFEGADKRDEPAIVILEVVTDTAIVITHPETGRQIQATPLPEDPAVELWTELEPRDKEFGEQVLLNRNPELPLFAVSTISEEMIKPVLVDGLQTPVVAMWVPKRNQVWYIVPREPNWSGIVRWLVSRAIPTLVPEVAARVRGLSPPEDRFLARDEREHAEAVARFDQHMEEERADLVRALEAAQERASEVRDRLLYEDGEELVTGVRTVLASCGFSLESLDEQFGGGRSSDLLATRQGKHWLIEVRGKIGPARESDVADVVKHRTTWPNLRSELLEGSVLVVNHQRQVPVSRRQQAPYERPEFVQALESFGVTVIGTMALCEWWAGEDCNSIVQAITGPPRQFGVARGE